MKSFSAFLAALLLPIAALANQITPVIDTPSLPTWEQVLLQNLTGPNGPPLALGAPPALSGTCATNTQVGGMATGTFRANGSCASGTVIITFPFAALNGYDCSARDLTTPADTLTASAFTTTSFTFATVTMAASDVVVFSCRAF